MNHCGIQQFADGDLVVCPKPRRLGFVNSAMNESVRPSGPELLDLILAKSGGYGAPDPFFCGSPPSRVSNPLIQDTRFRDNKIPFVSPESVILNPSSSSRRPSYGNKPAVRIEGFDCLDRDNRRNRSVPALA